MKSSELAALLMRHPEVPVVLKVGEDWVEVCGVKYIGEHRAAPTVTFETVNSGCEPNLGPNHA